MEKHNESDSPNPGEDSGVADILLLKDRALDVAAEGITIADMRLPEQPLIYINEGFERLTGYSAKSIYGNNCRFLQCEDTDPGTIEQIRAALKSGEECTVEILNQTKNGERFWNRLSLTPVKDALGEVTHFIGIQSDITKRRYAEESLRKANRQLELTNRRMKGDLEAAAKIQRSLLPNNAPISSDIEFSWVFEPCDELAGDTLNVFPIDEHRYAVYVLDVSGHGVRASLLSVTMSHWFSRLRHGTDSDLTENALSPVDVAEELNRQFPMDMENAQFFTMCFGIVDVLAREFRYVSAGNPPVIISGKDNATETHTVEGFPVGIVKAPGYSENVVSLNPGDRVFIYTDGASEAEDEGGNQYGTDRLAREIGANNEKKLDECLVSIIQDLKVHEGHRGHEDDVSILAFEITAAQQGVSKDSEIIVDF